MRSAFAVLLLAHAGSGFETDECKSLGFTEDLLCNACDTLAETISDEGLIGECRGCCKDAAELDGEKYHSAKLKICQ